MKLHENYKRDIRNAIDSCLWDFKTFGKDYLESGNPHFVLTEIADKIGATLDQLKGFFVIIENPDWDDALCPTSLQLNNMRYLLAGASIAHRDNLERSIHILKRIESNQ